MNFSVIVFSFSNWELKIISLDFWMSWILKHGKVQSQFSKLLKLESVSLGLSWIFQSQFSMFPKRERLQSQKSFEVGLSKKFWASLKTFMESNFEKLLIKFVYLKLCQGGFDLKIASKSEHLCSSTLLLPKKPQISQISYSNLKKSPFWVHELPSEPRNTKKWRKRG